MNPHQIAEKLASRARGGIFSIISRRPCKTLKGCPFVIEKLTKQQGILAEYSARKSVKEGIESGERDEPELPKGVRSCYKIGNVKFYEYMNGNTGVAVPLAGNPAISIYYVDGVETPKEKIEHFLLASEKIKPESKEELQKIFHAPHKIIGCSNIIDVI